LQERGKRIKYGGCRALRARSPGLCGWRIAPDDSAIPVTRRPAMPDQRTFSGGCHCGQVRFEVTTDLAQVMSCNCSICTKHGLLLTFVAPEQFALRAGAEDLSEYQFNKKVIHHRFCPVCGVESFARGAKPDGAPMVAINVRCLEGVYIGALKPMPYDGRSR